MIPIKKLKRLIPMATLACMLAFFTGNLSATDTFLEQWLENEDAHNTDNELANDDDHANDQNSYSRFLKPVVTAIDYHTRMIYLFNYENDKLIIVDPTSIDGWPGDIPLQHTAVTPSAKKMYITTDNTNDHPSYIIALKIKKINWSKGSAKIKLDEIMTADFPGMPAELPLVTPVEGNEVQDVPAWLLASGTQVHGPTFLPYSKYMYWTEFTSDRVRVVDLRKNELASIDPIIIPNYTEQTHGIVFNKSGSIGLGSGYYFDNNKIDIYKPNKKTGELQELGQIMLGTENEYAAFTHYVYWLDERYALTASMQFDKTSLTPEGATIIPPSVWLLDAIGQTATLIIGATDDVDGHGIFRSASDLAVVNGKLYIAEEDSIDFEFGQDGYISVFDLNDRQNPVFLKRLKPGDGLPEGYSVAHTISPTPDHRFLIIGSWNSGYVLKLDTATNKIVKTWGPEDGLVKPHGLFSAGSNR